VEQSQTDGTPKWMNKHILKSEECKFAYDSQTLSMMLERVFRNYKLIAEIEGGLLEKCIELKHLRVIKRSQQGPTLAY
jgi:hypothetical protein